eukprot:gnl/TRDRNA2_/TRDRNA2_87925_c0_seq1.p1 gnl/TRDRNA2_/TRDRNA2_87925_c0~~gnl/TRDRNA2_/TRDRNA2_87925_c0_seq1.p1  ORF type:complete len:574 (-),score=63.83 gnl/TRDRNA2_/TRDRNA2_87925_c0_seq1:74-1795(-)
MTASFRVAVAFILSILCQLAEAKRPPASHHLEAQADGSLQLGREGASARKHRALHHNAFARREEMPANALELSGQVWHDSDAAKTETSEFQVLSPEPVAAANTDESWWARLEGSLFSVFLGVMVLSWSLPVLWVNERNQVAMESLLLSAQRDCIAASADQVDKTNRGKLVHVSGQLCSCVPLVDERFDDVRFEKGCARLQSVVEVYRWVETPVSVRCDDCESEALTEYRYSLEWCTTFEDSQHFQEAAGHENLLPPMIRLGFAHADAERVSLGNFEVPQDLLQNITTFQPAEQHLPSKISASPGLRFCRAPDQRYFYCRAHSDKQTGETVADQVGDLRVHFMWVPDSPITVVALQTGEHAQSRGIRRKSLDDSATEGRETFAPYRPIWRSAFRWGPDDERKALLIAARQSHGEVAHDRLCFDKPLCCLCCCCSLAIRVFSSRAVIGEVYYISEKEETMKESFTAIQRTAGSLRVWGSRLLGWLLMFLGLILTTHPFIGLFASGPPLQKFGSGAIWLLCFGGTGCLTLLVTLSAYAIYRPMLAILMAITLSVAVIVPYMVQFYLPHGMSQRVLG